MYVTLADLFQHDLVICAVITVMISVVKNINIKKK